MSETSGLHTRLTADSGNFTQAMDAARTKLSQFAVEERKIKNEIALVEKELKEQTAAQGKNGTEVKKLEEKLQKLLKKELDLKANVKAVTDDVNRQTQAFAKNANEAQNVVSASGKIANGLNIIKGIALGYAGKTLFSALIGSNAEFEQSMTSFEVLLGSADKATALMEDLNKFGAETPFELPEITQATTQLLAFGTAEDEVMDKLQQLGDLSMGNAEKLDRITNAYGKMLAKGKVSLEELNMFTEAGVPILEELQKQYGVTQEELFKMITAGKVNIDGINAAMESMTSQGGQFFGMMEKQSQTMSGMWSTLTDNINMFAREVGEESFDYLKDELSNLIDTINQMEESGQLQEIASEIGEGVANAITFIGNFVKLLWDMRDVLTAAGTAVLVYKASVGTLSTAISAFNTVTTLCNVLSGKSVICKNTETGATFTLTAAEAKAVTAKNASIVAQSKLNAVTMANPYVAVASAILAVVAALVMFAVKANDAKKETDSLKKETKKLTEEYNNLKDSCEDAVAELERTETATISQMKAARDLIPELETLISKTERTEEENNRLNQIIAQLNTAFPNLKLAIDSETGALNQQIGTVYAAADAWIELAKAKAAATYIETLDLQTINNDNIIKNSLDIIDEANKDIEEAQSVLDDPDSTEWEQEQAIYKKIAAQNTKENAGQTGMAAVRDNEELEKNIKWANDTYSPYSTISTQESILKDLGVDSTINRSFNGGSSGGSGGDDAEKQRKARLTAYKNANKEWIDDDKKLHDELLERNQITEEQYLEGIKNRANAYGAWAKEVLALEYLTAEEKAELSAEYLEKQKDAEFEAYKYNKKLKQTEFDEFEELLTNEAEALKKDGKFDEAKAKYEEIKEKALEYFNEGIYTGKEYEKIIKGINEEIAGTDYDKFQHSLSESKKYIERLENGEGVPGDTTIEAWQRVQDKIQEAFDNGIIGYLEYCELIDETNQSIAEEAQKEAERMIEEEEERLKKKYEKLYEIEKESLEKQLDLVKENCEAEKKAVRERADAEIAAIDELIAARKREKEDREDNLKLQRLMTRLEYEMDEENRIELQKEITRLKEEIDDKLFEREMSDKKDAIESEADAAIAALDAEIEAAEKSFDKASELLDEEHEQNTSGSSIAMEVYKNLGFGEMENLVNSLNGSIDENVRHALSSFVESMQDNLNSMSEISGRPNYYTTKYQNYSPTYHVTGASVTASDLRKADERNYNAFVHTRRFS